MLLGVVRKSTRPEIALVEPIGADQSSCTRSAVVIAVSRVPSRKTAIVMAEDSGFCCTMVMLLVLDLSFTFVIYCSCLHLLLMYKL